MSNRKDLTTALAILDVAVDPLPLGDGTYFLQVPVQVGDGLSVDRVAVSDIQAGHVHIVGDDEDCWKNAGDFAPIAVPAY